MHIKYKNKRPIKRFNKKIIIVIAVVLALLVVGLAVVLTHRHPKATSGQIKETTKGTTKTSAPAPAAPGSTTQPDQSQPAPDKSSSTGSQGSSSSELIAPYGSLVSNHRPGQNGTNLAESSQCTTTASAKCYIKFTQGTVVKTLPEKSVDATGSIFWDWNVKDAGLTSGEWTVTAVATLGDQSKTTKDQLVLEVQ